MQPAVLPRIVAPPLALRRVLGNLRDNARRYGGGLEAWLMVSA